MPRYSRRRIITLLAKAESAPSSDAKGDLFEDLVEYVFTKVKGVSVLARNILDGPRAHEIDLALLIETGLPGLSFLNGIILIECKHTASPLGSDGVSRFATKLRARGLPFGILVSQAGITGAADGVSAAHCEILGALAKDGTRILLLDREELQSLTTTQELLDRLKEKYVGLVVYRKVQ
jgi:hypothetical protein